MTVREDLSHELQTVAHQVAGARNWPDFVASAYVGFELATRTTRALVDVCPPEQHARLAEAESAATDGRDILRAAPGRMNAVGSLGSLLVLAADRADAAETALGRLVDALHDRFGMALDEPLNADELVAFSEAMDAADRLQRALSPEANDDDLP